MKDFFSKCDQIRRKLRILSNLLKKSLMENLFFCAVQCGGYCVKSDAHLGLCQISMIELFYENS